jgi:hypothetical protein
LNREENDTSRKARNARKNSEKLRGKKKKRDDSKQDEIEVAEVLSQTG